MRNLCGAKTGRNAIGIYNIVDQNTVAIFLEHGCRWLSCPTRAPHREEYANQNSPVSGARTTSQSNSPGVWIDCCVSAKRKDRRSQRLPSAHLCGEAKQASKKTDGVGEGFKTRTRGPLWRGALRRDHRWTVSNHDKCHIHDKRFFVDESASTLSMS